MDTVQIFGYLGALSVGIFLGLMGAEVRLSQSP